ncbi:MAG: LytTR family transcriptional regulator [Muribaculaceae bacterium]|nr:LytTR family transcriptional regulator [Muribaculaceae bacterium]
MKEHLLFSSSTELVRVSTAALVYITAEGNYSTAYLADGGEYVLTLQLGQIERRIEEQAGSDDGHFIRIGKSLIVNKDYITYINPGRQRLILSDGRSFKHELSASREALKSLKEFLEQEA